jgi:hypothetical protein
MSPDPRNILLPRGGLPGDLADIRAIAALGQQLDQRWATPWLWDSGGPSGEDYPNHHPVIEAASHYSTFTLRHQITGDNGTFNASQDVTRVFTRIATPPWREGEVYNGITPPSPGNCYIWAFCPFFTSSGSASLRPRRIVPFIVPGFDIFSATAATAEPFFRIDFDKFAAEFRTLEYEPIDPESELEQDNSQELPPFPYFQTGHTYPYNPLRWSTRAAGGQDITTWDDVDFHDILGTYSDTWSQTSGGYTLTHTVTWTLA